MATLPLDLLARLRGCPEIFAALEDCASDELKAQKELRGRYPAELVRGACEVDALRRRGTEKFSRAERMWFDRTALEQSTHEVVARHTAERFEGAVRDLCCGIGGDTVALAERCEVLAVDVDAARAHCTAWNAEVYEVADRVTVSTADVAAQDWRGGLVHVDPDRRSQQRRRARRVADYVPGPDSLRSFISRASGGAIKLSPASDFDRHFSDCEIELVSLHGECKVANVWFGDLASGHRRRATVLPAGESLIESGGPSTVPCQGLGPYLYDPDPAVVRAGLVDELAGVLGVGRLDESEEYLTGDARVRSPFVRRYIVEDSVSADAKRLRRCLQQRGVGRLEIKSRRLPIDHERLRRRLRLTGDHEATLVMARTAGGSRGILCHPDV